jgi:hypothetical protein
LNAWRQAQITDERAKLILYAAFVDGELEAPRSLLPDVHRLYFEPQYVEFSARTMWSLSNAFTSAFKKLEPTDGSFAFNVFPATSLLSLSPKNRILHG